MLYLLPMIVLGVLGSSSLCAQQLDQYRWKNRVLLVFAPNLQDQRLKSQLSLFDAHRAGLAERDLKLMVLNPGGNEAFSTADTKHLYQAYKVEKDAFVLILIGKDGGEKLRKTQPLAVATLFSTIDAMPMRQAEMERK
ncbi:DUF4174 domain-containing protein [Haliscomenobacter sp.]|uniref:DUF4174 domain-containing protein n=1 Tax=Haliscomenobacter sp. TaxID=2717303 RepID=UPI0035943197